MIIVKYNTKSTAATTDYVDISLEDHTRVHAEMIGWITRLNEDLANKSSGVEGFFKPRIELPKRRGGQNSVMSYISGILNNQLFRPNSKTGRLQADFTEENLDWINIVSGYMHEVYGTEVIVFEEHVWA